MTKNSEEQPNLEELAQEAFQFTEKNDPVFMENFTHIAYLLCNLRAAEIIRLNLHREFGELSTGQKMSNEVTYNVVRVGNQLVDPLVNYLSQNKDVIKLRFNPKGKYTFPIDSSIEIPILTIGKEAPKPLTKEQLSTLLKEYPIDNIVSAYHYSFQLVGIQLSAQRSGLTRKLYVFDVCSTDEALKVLEQDGFIIRREIVEEPDILSNYVGPFLPPMIKSSRAHLFKNNFSSIIFASHIKDLWVLEEGEGEEVIPHFIVVRPVRCEEVYTKSGYSLIEYGLEVKTTYVGYKAHELVLNACKEIESALQNKGIPFIEVK